MVEYYEYNIICDKIFRNKILNFKMFINNYKGFVINDFIICIRF